MVLGEPDVTPVRTTLLGRRGVLVGLLGGGVDVSEPRSVPYGSAVDPDQAAVAPVVAPQPLLQRPVER